MPVNPKKATGLPGDAKSDPIGSYQFEIEVDGLNEARFTEISSVDHTTKVIEHREVGKDGQIYINKLIGGSTFSDVTFKRGVTKDNDFWQKWRQTVIDGDYSKARKTVTVRGLSPKGEPVSVFVLQRAWPSKWKGPAFSAKNDAVAIEEITFTHEGIERVN
jgi:phage tail-like protein